MSKMPKVVVRLRRIYFNFKAERTWNTEYFKTGDEFLTTKIDAESGFA